MKTHQIRRALGKKYTQQYFCQTYQIPLATIKNWDSRGTAPDWLLWVFSDLIHWRRIAREYREKLYDALSAGIEDEDKRKELRQETQLEFSYWDEEIFNSVMDYIEGKESSFEP